MDLDNMNRKLNIRIFGVLTVILIVLGLVFLLIHFSVNKTQYIEYNENGDINYDVLLDENDFFENNILESDSQYIAKIVNGIDANFKYNMNIENDFIYKYKITADVEVIEKQTSKPLYEASEDIISTSSRMGNTSFEINEKVFVDYKKYNDLINKFINTYNLKNTISSLELNMYVDISSNGLTMKNYVSPVMTLKIPLAVNTLAIDTDNKLSNGSTLMINSSIEKEYVWLKIACTIWVVDFCILLGAILYYISTATPEEKYKFKLKNILNSYGSYISVVEDNFDISEYKVLKVTNFIDLLEIRDTIHVPIIMVEDKSTMVTYFAIPQNEFLYYFSLSIDRPALKEGGSNINDENLINR